MDFVHQCAPVHDASVSVTGQNQSDMPLVDGTEHTLFHDFVVLTPLSIHSMPVACEDHSRILAHHSRTIIACENHSRTHRGFSYKGRPGLCFVF